MTPRDIFEVARLLLQIIFAGEVFFVSPVRGGKMIALFVILLIIGFIALIKGADFFIDGSSKIAGYLGVSGLIIGLTIVAMGTSAPELAVSTIAAIQGSNEIALSNVLGSNTFNLLGVLGVCAIVSPLPVDKNALKRDFPLSVIITIILMLVTCGSTFLNRNIAFNEMNTSIGTVSKITGAVMLIIFTGYIIMLIKTAHNDKNDNSERQKSSIAKCVLLILLGLILIIGGGQAVVYSAKEIARSFGMTETLIGLTIVAIGTSLPELVTSLVAAHKGETGLAIGNAIGSNLFNVMFILGISSVIRPITVNVASLYDMIILIVISVLTYIFSLSSKRITRIEGVVMISIYVLYVVFAIVR